MDGIDLGTSSTEVEGGGTVPPPPPPTPVAATPKANPGFGPVPSGQKVTLSTETDGAAIYYTINGGAPSASAGTKYSTPFTISSFPATVKAIAVKSGMNDSSVLEGTYTLLLPGTVATPTANPGAGRVDAVAYVTLSCATAGAKIYYTKNGSDPEEFLSATTFEFDAYFGQPIMVVPPMTITAVARKEGMVDSGKLVAAYTTLSQATGWVDAPTASPEPGGITSGQSITLRSATSGADIYYTINGEDPTPETGMKYSGPFTLSSLPATVRAMAVKPGMNDSGVSYLLYYSPVSSSTIDFWPVQMGGATYADVQNGRASTVTPSSAIRITFSAPVASLTANDIYISTDTGAVTKGNLSGSGTSWTIYITVTKGGYVNVGIRKQGIYDMQKPVEVIGSGQGVPEYKYDWTKGGVIPFNPNSIAEGYDPVIGKTVLVAVGPEGKIARSTDGGATWTSKRARYPTNTRYTAQGWDRQTSLPENYIRAVTSNNGGNWFVAVSMGDEKTVGVEYDVGRISTKKASGKYGAVFVSWDAGDTWQIDYPLPYLDYFSVVWSSADNKFLVGASSRANEIPTLDPSEKKTNISNPGQWSSGTWDVLSVSTLGNPTPDAWRDIYGIALDENGLGYAVCRGGETLVKLSSGSAWRRASTPDASIDPIMAVAYGRLADGTGKFVAGGNAFVGYQYGFEWWEAASPFTDEVLGVAYRGATAAVGAEFFAVGKRSMMAWSVDGETWTQAPLVDSQARLLYSTPIDIKCIIYSGNRWIAISGGQILYAHAK